MILCWEGREEDGDRVDYGLAGFSVEKSWIAKPKEIGIQIGADGQFVVNLGRLIWDEFLVEIYQQTSA